MLGSRLKQLREEKQLTQDELSDEMNISRSAISLYEIDKRAPDYDTLIKLSDYFDVTADFLLGKSDQRKCSPDDLLGTEKPAAPDGEQPVNEVNADLIGEVQDLSEEEAAKVREYAQLLKLKRKQRS